MGMVKENLLEEIFQLGFRDRKASKQKGAHGAKLPKLDRLLDGHGG